MSRRTVWLGVCAALAMGLGCSSKEEKGAPNTGGTGGTTAGTGGSVAGTGGTTAGTGGSTAGTGGSTAGTGEMPDGTVFEMQFPDVTDWNALEIVYPVSYTGFDGVHTFSLPMRVRCASVPLEAWHADPATAVTFDADPENENGVMVTIVDPTAEITIAVVQATLGGLAPIHVTMGTPEQWALGEERYNNGADWSLDILMPMAPPPDTKCTVCHGENSGQDFDIQHTPTQAARISDEGLEQIMTTGTKPEDVPFRVLPPTFEFGGTTYTNAELYKMFHLWEATDDQLLGMILYLRSLTPTGQGCVTDPRDGMCKDVEADPNAECM